MKCSRYTGWEIRQCSVGEETVDLELYNKEFKQLPQEKGHFEQSDLRTKALRWEDVARTQYKQDTG